MQEREHNGDDDVWQLSCDGTAAPNPGNIGIGAVLVAPDGARHTISRAGGARGCNNEAEAQALIAVLTRALELGARRAVVHSDSDVVVTHVAAGVDTTVARLMPLYQQARALLTRFDRIELRLVPRRKIGEADALARAAVGLAPKP